MANDDLEKIIMSLFNESPEDCSFTRRESNNIDCRMESALSSHISEKLQTKALPLALRKRLLYEKAIAEKRSA